jgi:hypothetical protein
LKRGARICRAVCAVRRFPVKSEFYGFEGDQKILKFSVEMKNVKLLVEDSVFQIPVDYRKVSIEDFRTILDKENFNEE